MLICDRQWLSLHFSDVNDNQIILIKTVVAGSNGNAIGEKIDVVSLFLQWHHYFIVIALLLLYSYQWIKKD